MAARRNRLNRIGVRPGIGDHPQLAYVRCPYCKSPLVAAEQGKAIRLSNWVFVRDGRQPSKSPFIRGICGSCGKSVRGRAHYQSIPCVGDTVEFATNPSDPGGSTLTGRVRQILPDNELGVPSGVEVVLEDGTVATMDIFSPRLLWCVRAVHPSSKDGKRGPSHSQQPLEG
jgi:hypothetical protein